MGKRNTTRPVLALIFLSMLVGGCAGIRKWPEEIPPQDPITKLYYELNAVAAAERIGEEGLILRFPLTAFFGSDEYSLMDDAKRDLEKVAGILCEYPGFTVIVEGHTDSRGRECYNQWLSERRSRIVADFLVSEGLDPEGMQVVGYGELRPFTTNETLEGRQRNRRVELRVTPPELFASQ